MRFPATYGRTNPCRRCSCRRSCCRERGRRGSGRHTIEHFGNIMGALDAHNAMSTQALNSPAIQGGIKDILLNYARLWEGLRAEKRA